MMKRNWTKSLLSMFLAASVLLSLVGSAFAAEQTVDNVQLAFPEPEITAEEGQLLDTLVDVMEVRLDSELTVAEAKPLYDFAGNLYYVTEFDPIGYMITQAQSGEIVEYTMEAHSPYLGRDSGLFYAGPTYYYYDDGQGLTHTILDETIDYESAAACGEECQALYDTLLEVDRATDIALDLETGTSTINATTTTSYYPQNSYFLKNLVTAEQIGYRDKTENEEDSSGVCGYIASGLLMLWMDYRSGNDNLINDFTYLNRSGNAFIGRGFTDKLRSFGTQDGSSGNGLINLQSLEDVIQAYCQSIKCSIATHVITLPGEYGIINIMQNYSPVITCGSLYDVQGSGYIQHCVLAYGYTSANELIVHYGWPPSFGDTYSNIILNQLALGTALYISATGTDTIFFSDIPQSNWAYNSAAYCSRYNIIDNTSSSYFSPNTSMSRGRFVEALYRLEGTPDLVSLFKNETEYNQYVKTMESTYADFSSASAFHDAAVWARKKGILSGTSSTTLSLSSNLTREQAVMFLYEYSNATGFSFSSTNGPSYTSFSDYSSVSSWARNAMNWATKRYLVQGSDGLLLPAAQLTRAQSASLLHEFSKRALR